MKQKAQNRRGNFIDQVVYTGTPVTKNTPLPAGHAELHTHNSEVAQKIIDNQIIIDELIGQESDLNDRVTNLEQELDGLTEATQVYFFKIDTQNSINDSLEIGHARPLKENDTFSPTWGESTTIQFSDFTYAKTLSERKQHGSYNYLRANDSGYFNDEFHNLVKPQSCPVKDLTDVRMVVKLSKGSTFDDFGVGNFVEVSKGNETSVLEITKSEKDPNNNNRVLVTLNWLHGENFNLYHYDKMQIATISKGKSHPFDASTVFPGQTISVVETDDNGNALPDHHYVMGVVMSVDPGKNTVTYNNQYSNGDVIDGDFIIVQYLPSGQSFEGYATMDWSNSTFANDNHNHSYSLDTHSHSNYSSTNHSHNYATTPDDATKDKKGLFKLGAVPTGTNGKPSLAQGQLYYNTQTKMFLVGV